MTTPNPGSLPSYGESGPEGAAGSQPPQGQPAPQGQSASQTTPGGYPAYPAHPNGPQGDTSSTSRSSSPGGTDQPFTAAQPGYTQPSYMGQSSLGDQYAQFDVNTAASMAGSDALRYHGQQLADGLYGDGTQPHPINDPAANGWTHTKGTGRLRLGETISWAFKAFAANPRTMLIIGVVAAILNALSSSSAAPPFAGILAGLAMLFIAPVFVSAALQQTLVRKFSKMQTPAYGKTLGLVFILAFLTFIAMMIVITIGSIAAVSSVDLESLPTDPDMMMTDPFMMGEFGRIFGITFGVTLLISLLLAPFVIYPLFYAADNNRTFGYALGEGIKAGARNYLPTLGLAAVLLVINLLGAAPAILALTAAIPPVVGSIITAIVGILLTPFTLLAIAHAYRQVSGGPVPHEAAAAPATPTTATDAPAL